MNPALEVTSRIFLKKAFLPIAHRRKRAGKFAVQLVAAGRSERCRCCLITAHRMPIRLPDIFLFQRRTTFGTSGAESFLKRYFSG